MEQPVADGRIPADGQPLQYDRATMAAIGITSGFLILATHEILGHSLATVALGAHLVRLTSIDSSYSGPASSTVMRVIAGAGIAANLVVGWLVLSLGRFVPEGRATIRYFVWVFGHATLFMGSSYLAGFAFLPFGDVNAAIAGLGSHFVIAILALATGAALYRFALIDARRTFARWRHGEDLSRSRQLAVVPYLAMGAVVTLTSSLNPNGAFIGALWGAAATFGANYGLVAAADSGVLGTIPSTGQRMDVVRGRGWIAAGVASTLLLFLGLGPGVPR